MPEHNKNLKNIKVENIVNCCFGKYYLDIHLCIYKDLCMNCNLEVLFG